MDLSAIGMSHQVRIVQNMKVIFFKGKLLHKIVEKDNQILCLDYSPDGLSFASAGKDYKVFNLFNSYLILKLGQDI